MRTRLQPVKARISKGQTTPLVELDEIPLDREQSKRIVKVSRTAIGGDFGIAVVGEASRMAFEPLLVDDKLGKQACATGLAGTKEIRPILVELPGDAHHPVSFERARRHDDGKVVRHDRLIGSKKDVFRALSTAGKLRE